MREHWRRTLCCLIEEVDCAAVCSFANFRSGDLWLALITFLYVSTSFLDVFHLHTLVSRMAVCHADSLADEATIAFSWCT